MKNMKSMLPNVVALGAVAFAYFGIDLPPNLQAEIVATGIAVAAAGDSAWSLGKKLIALFTAD